MSDGEIFLIEVARPGRDSVAAPVDYATMQADVTTLLSRPNIQTLDDVPDVDAGTPADGDVLVWDGISSGWILASLPSLPVVTGTGDPQGVETAEIGSLYLRTDAREGNQLWIKVSGSDAYGWLPSQRARRPRTTRTVYTYMGASLSTSHVASGFQNGPTVTANASSNADASTGAFLQHNTSSSSGNVASVVAGNNSGVRLDWRPDISFGIRTPATITDIRSWWGMFASSPASSNDPSIEGCGFRFSTGASDSTFQAWSNDGSGGGLITDTGVTIVSGVAHDLRIVTNDAFDALDFFIDGSWVARHDSDLPGATTELNYGIYCTTLTAGQRALRWGRITLETRP